MRYTKEQLLEKRLNQIARKWQYAKRKNNRIEMDIYLSHFKFLLGGYKYE